MPEGPIRSPEPPPSVNASGRVIAMHRNTGRRAGKQLDVECCVVFEIEDGRCVDGREYVFDLHAWDEFWS